MRKLILATILLLAPFGAAFALPEVPELTSTVTQLQAQATDVVVHAAAQAPAIPAEPDILDLLDTDYEALFLTAAAFGAFLILLTSVIKALVRRFFNYDIKGIIAYAMPFALGILGGVIAQYSGLLLDPEYSNVRAPMGGIGFGIASAFAAVTGHQGLKQTKATTALRSASARARTK